MPWQPPTVVLVHSPFLGPTSLRPLADALAARSTPAVLLDLRVTVAAAPVHARMIGSFADALSEALSESPGESLDEPGGSLDEPLDDDHGEPTESLVLVGHSGAGPLLPAFADALDEPVVGLVFLDAGLPTPGLSWRDTAPPALYEEMRGRSRDGLMPAWPYWFTPDPLPRLIPDTVLRAQIAEEAPEVPVAFLKEARPSVEWSGPAAYLQLSGAYDRDMAAARRRGWPVRRLDSNHLAAATEPDLVADALLRLLAQLDAPDSDT